MPAKDLSENLETCTLMKYLGRLENMTKCSGVLAPELQGLSGPLDDNNRHFCHTQYEMVNGKLHQKTCVRAKACHGLVSDKTICKECSITENVLRQKLLKINERMSNMKPNDPLHGLQATHLKEKLKEARQDCADLKKKLQTFKYQLEGDEGVEVSAGLHDSLKQCNKSQMTELQAMFWEEQEKAFRCKDRGKRWHPMMIRLAILLHSKSKAAYDLLRETGVLKLPGNSTLREYVGALHPKEGFQPEVMDDLKARVNKMPENQRHVVLLHDEMTIKSDLLFDSRDGSLVGFVNKDKWSFDHSNEELANQVLVFFVVGVNSSLKQSIGYFGTRAATADELLPLFWTAIGCLEETGLKVIASTSDKAPPNQRLYQMHQVIFIMIYIIYDYLLKQQLVILVVFITFLKDPF